MAFQYRRTSMTMMAMNFKYCHKIMKKHSKAFLTLLTCYQKIKEKRFGQFMLCVVKLMTV